MLIELNQPDLSIRRQCELLGLNRSNAPHRGIKTCLGGPGGGRNIN